MVTATAPAGPLTDEQRALAEAYARKWPDPAAVLWKVYPALCRRARACRLDNHDLRSLGWAGVLEAARRFDPANGCSFATYALWWMRAKVGHAATATLAKARGGGRVTFSGDAPARGPFGKRPPSLWDAIGVADPTDPAGDPAEFDRLDGARAAVRDALRFLGPHARRVLELRYGLLDGRARTLDETADELAAEAGSRVTRERVRQVEAKAFERVRVPLLLAAGHLAGGVCVADPPPAPEPSARAGRPKVGRNGRRGGVDFYSQSIPQGGATVARKREAPAKPSAEADELWRFMAGEAAKYPDLATDAVLRLVAVAVVRRYPGFTQTPPPGLFRAGDPG
jgi:RNA polymerase sigma factor (sigma-70 family)